MFAPESVPGASINDRRLYIGNLSWNFDSEGKLKQFLAGRGFGNATEMKLPMDKESGLPRGFAFVTFPTPEAGPCTSSLCIL